MRDPRFRASLEQIVLTLATALGTTGCGISTEGYEPVSCDSAPLPLADLSLDSPADYVELISRESYDDTVAWTSESATGTPCATATDVGACEAAIAAATSTTGFQLGQCVQVCTTYALIVNRGDDVSVVDSLDLALAELGTIDAAAEAVMVARMNGYSVSCDDPDRGGVRAAGDGWEVIATRMTSDCAPIIVERYQLGVSADGVVTEILDEIESRDASACVGRRPSGLCPARSRGRSALGAWLAETAHLELAAVHAFEELDAEMAAHGAPAELRRGLAAARRDEIRHGRVMRRIAARFGGQVATPVVSRRPVRPLEEIARDNAVEGCVRETYGALFGRWQALHAADPEIRAAMGRIADDEARHAELSWALADWMESRLDEHARARVRAARDAALAALAAEVEAVPVEAPVAELAGLPSASVRVALAAQLAALVADRAAAQAPRA